MAIKWLFKSGFRVTSKFILENPEAKTQQSQILKKNLDDSTWKTNEPPMLKEVLLFFDIISNSYLLYIQQTENPTSKK